jgi:hypothetical protein
MNKLYMNRVGHHAGSKRGYKPVEKAPVKKQRSPLSSFTQHERVVAFRARRMGISIKAYARQFGSKNLPHLIKD